MNHPANPDQWDILAELQADPENREVLGDLWKAAEEAGVKPGTIRVWMTRGKITPVLGAPGQELFHIPTVKEIAAAGRKNTPADPAANSRGHHARRTRPEVAA
jgi:hypothetical protein